MLTNSCHCGCVAVAVAMPSNVWRTLIHGWMRNADENGHGCVFHVRYDVRNTRPHNPDETNTHQHTHTPASIFAVQRVSKDGSSCFCPGPSRLSKLIRSRMALEDVGYGDTWELYLSGVRGQGRLERIARGLGTWEPLVRFSKDSRIVPNGNGSP